MDSTNIKQSAQHLQPAEMAEACWGGAWSGPESVLCSTSAVLSCTPFLPGEEQVGVYL